MNQSPIPFPENDRCPHCGQNVAPGTVMCPYCGTRLRADGGTSIWRVFGALFLGCFGLLAGAAGGCALILGAGSLTDLKDSWQVLLLALGGLAIAAGCVWGIIKLLKRN